MSNKSYNKVATHEVLLAERLCKPGKSAINSTEDKGPGIITHDAAGTGQNFLGHLSKPSYGQL